MERGVINESAEEGEGDVEPQSSGSGGSGNTGGGVPPLGTGPDQRPEILVGIQVPSTHIGRMSNNARMLM
jgi:hypothetical protein